MRLERHYTPPALAAACMARLARHGLIVHGESRLIDPCCGEGAFVLNDWDRDIRLDLEPHCMAYVADFFTVSNVGGDLRESQGIRIGGLFPRVIPVAESDRVIASNPPFTQAEAFIRHGLSIAPTVAYLLRVGFITPASGRGALHRELPPSHVFPIYPRPLFTGPDSNGSADRYDYAFFVWERKRPPSTMLHLSDPIVWVPPSQNARADSE